MAAPAGDGASIRETITQANTFAAEDVVYNNGGTWALARANAVATAKYTGVVESADASSFVVVYAGRIELALTAGTTYYLSDTTAGLLELRADIGANELLVPVVRAVSASEAIVMASRDVACDLLSLILGDVTAGGGGLRINVTANNSVTIAAADFVGTSRAIKVREIDICEAGVAKKMLVLCSASYT
jgi:hypothetical protein